MIKRALLLVQSVFLTLFVVSASMAAEIGADGLHKQDWFAITFRDIADDVEVAREDGKRLVLIYEQRGCIYCEKIHEEILTIPEVRDYIKDNYMVIQYNLYGDEAVIDTDGEELTEKSAARKWGLTFTPSIIFLPEEAKSDENAFKQAVAVMPGAFMKGTFLDMFTWVREKGYETDETFQQYHARAIRARRARGSGAPD